MRYIITLAALALLFAAAWISWGGGNEYACLDMPCLQEKELSKGSALLVLRSEEALDGDVDRLIRYGADWRDRPDMWVAGGELSAIPVDTLQEGSVARPTELAVRHLQPVELGLGQTLPQVRGVEALDGWPALESWYITIYCCENDPGGAYCSKTALGTQVREGVVACDPRYLGSRFSLGESVYACEDLGSAVWGHHLDVWFYDCGDQQDPEEGTGWWWLQEVGTRVEVIIIE